MHILLSSDPDILLSLCHFPTFLTLPDICIRHPILDQRFELRTKVGDMELLLTDDCRFGVSPRLAIPAKLVLL